MESSPSSSSPSTPSSSSHASSSTPSGSSQGASTPSSASSSDVALMEKELLEGASGGPSSSSSSGAAGGTGSGGISGPIVVYTGNQEQGDGEWMDVAHTQASAVAGVSAAGVGPSSEILDCHLANPGEALLPTDIKVTNTQTGIVVTWEPPFINSVETVYTVRLVLEQEVSGLSSGKARRVFEPIYHGRNRICVVPWERLAKAKVDKTDKPCAIFWVTAKTGSQEATIQVEVRWLQDKEGEDGLLPRAQNNEAKLDCSHLVNGLFEFLEEWDALDPAAPRPNQGCIANEASDEVSLLRKEVDDLRQEIFKMKSKKGEDRSNNVWPCFGIMLLVFMLIVLQVVSMQPCTRNFFI